VVPDLPSRAGRAVPTAVLLEDQPADAAALRARVAGTSVPDLQGLSGRFMPHTLGTSDFAHAPGAAATRRYELASSESVWQELEARGVTIASVPFSGRAGRGGHVDRIVLHRLDGDELVDVERWTSHDELGYALEGPIWDRFGSFAGQPRIAGTLVWTTADRRVVIVGRRGDKRFEEFL
jgi:hypothetical protein